MDLLCMYIDALDFCSSEGGPIVWACGEDAGASY